MIGAVSVFLRQWRRPEGVPRLSGPAKFFLLGNSLRAFGAGLAMPYLSVLLIGFRGGVVTTAGFLATIAVVDIVAQRLLARPLERAKGSRLSAIAGCWVQAGGWMVVAVATAYHAMIAAAVIIGLGNALFFSVRISLQLELVPKLAQEYSFSLRYLLGNIGIMLGGLGGGSVVVWLGDIGIRVLMAANSATFIGFALILSISVRPVSMGEDPTGKTSENSAQEAPPAGPRSSGLPLPALRLIAAYFCVVTAGLAQFEIVLPLEWANHDGLDLSMAGFLVSALTLCTVVLQMPVSRLSTRIGGVSSFRALGCAWLVAVAVFFAGRGLDGPMQSAAFLLGILALASGECLFSPAIPGLLRTDDGELRQRTASLLATAHATGMFLGPSLGIALVTHTSAGAYGLIAAGGLGAVFVVRPLNASARRDRGQADTDSEDKETSRAQTTPG